MNRIVWTSDRPDVVLDGSAWHREMPMPTVRNPRAAEPWASVHRERGTRHRVTRRVDHAAALAWSLAHDVDLCGGDIDAELTERLALAELRARNAGGVS